jgi:hypothetical protein
MGYAAVAASVLILGLRGAAPPVPISLSVGAAVIAATAIAHAIFFGAGRYGLVVAPFVAAMAFAGSEHEKPPSFTKPRLFRNRPE